MAKRYNEKPHDELTRLQQWREYCESCAIAVLNGTRHLGETKDIELQKKKDYFLYKYYEYNFNKANYLIDKLCHIGNQ